MKLINCWLHVLLISFSHKSFYLCVCVCYVRRRYDGWGFSNEKRDKVEHKLNDWINDLWKSLPLITRSFCFRRISYPQARQLGVANIETDHSRVDIARRILLITQGILLIVFLVHRRALPVWAARLHHRLCLPAKLMFSFS